MKELWTRSNAPLVAAMAVILSVTLFPGSTPLQDVPSLCLLCGAYGTADFVLNVFLFVPLGYVALARLRGFRRALALIVLTTVSIELSQAVIPGRYPTVGDFAANVFGGIIGIWINTWRRRDHGSRMIARGLRWVGPFVAPGCMALTIVLLGSSLPETRYYGQWTPELASFEHYSGEVRDARSGDIEYPSRLLDSRATAAIHRAFTGESIVLDLIAGESPGRIAPIFAVFDEHQAEVVLIGARDDDIVVRMRRVAQEYGLHGPTKVFRDLHPDEGRATTIRLRRRGTAFCLGVEEEESCVVGESPARGWQLLTSAILPPGISALIDGIWLALLTFVPISFFQSMRRRRSHAFGDSLLQLTPPIAAYCILWILVSGNLTWIPGLVGILIGWGVTTRQL